MIPCARLTTCRKAQRVRDANSKDNCNQEESSKTNLVMENMRVLEGSMGLYGAGTVALDADAARRSTKI